MDKLIFNIENGVVQDPHLHDAFLIGIVFKANCVSLRFRTVTKRIACLDFCDLLGISIETLFENNIVFEIRVTPVANGTNEDFRRIFHLPENQEINISQIHDLKSKNLIFVQIDPTLGADVLALCRDAIWSFEQ